MAHMMIRMDATRLQLLEGGTLDESSPAEPQPSRMRLPLKPHQLAVLHRMRQLEEGSFEYVPGQQVSSTLGMLCDKVGSGKSMEVLARLCQQPLLAPRPQVQTGICLEAVHVSVSSTPQYRFLPTNLLVVPHGLVGQWRRYIEQHTDLTLFVLQRKNQLAQVPPEDGHPEVLLCSSTMCKPLAQHLGSCHVQFSRIIVDECTTINLPGCPVLCGCFHWLISSSVHSVLFPSGTYLVRSEAGSWERRFCDRMQRTGFLRNILANLEYFPATPSIFLRCTERFVDQSFQLPPPVRQTLICRAPAYMSLVAGIASSEITRMLHAGDVEGAIQLLPCPRGTVDNLLQRLTADLDARLLRCSARLQYYRQLLAGHLDPLQRPHVEERRREMQASLDHLETQRHTITERLRHHEVESCPICLDVPQHAAITGCCKHIFCAACLQHSLALRRCCPYCRQTTDENTMMLITDTPMVDDNAMPTKAERVLQCLREAEAAAPGAWRCLVFSNYESFGKLQQQLTAEGVRHSKLCGTGAAIQRQVQQFEAGEVPVLLLNATHYGAGLNLQRASHVILTHRMCADMEGQVIGRAQRTGRQHALQVTQLLHPGE
jgi:hypothetical protein